LQGSKNRAVKLQLKTPDITNHDNDAVLANSVFAQLPVCEVAGCGARVDLSCLQLPVPSLTQIMGLPACN
jgi:hypothetical protein